MLLFSSLVCIGAVIQPGESMTGLKNIWLSTPYFKLNQVSYIIKSCVFKQLTTIGINKGRKPNFDSLLFSPPGFIAECDTRCLIMLAKTLICIAAAGHFVELKPKGKYFLIKTLDNKQTEDNIESDDYGRYPEPITRAPRKNEGKLTFLSDPVY